MSNLSARPSPRRLRRALVAVLAVVALAPLGVVAASADPRDQLAETQRRIEDALGDLRAAEGRAAASEEELAAAQAQVDQLEADLNALLAVLEEQEARVAAAEAEAAAAAAERDRIQTVVNERARRAFMGSEPSPLIVLSSRGIDDVAVALDRLAMLDALTARADASMETLDAARTRADASAAHLAEEVAELQQVRATREGLLAEAEQVLDARAAAFAELDAARGRLQAEHAALERDADRLQAVIRREAAAARKKAEAARAAAEAAADDGGSSSSSSSSPPPAASGCYQWPASGRVTSEYGPRWGRMHAGLDIDGDTGDRIVAAQSGTVISAGYDGAYGNLTLISHSDGVTTAYAHQSKIAVRKGQSVSKGEYIGKMGATGRTTGSHLHFETRTGGGHRNPRNYLC